MATVSEVKAGLDSAANSIADSTSRRSAAKSNLLVARNQLSNLPTTLSDVISTVNAYTPTGAFETLAQDELDKLTTEYLALKADLEAELIATGQVAAGDYTSLPSAQKTALITELTAIGTVVSAAITTLGG